MKADMVLHEISGAPDGVSSSGLFNMLDEWQEANTHSLKEELSEVVKRIIEGDMLTCDHVVVKNRK